MIKRIFNDRTPGWVGKILIVIITAFWCYWSVGEMYMRAGGEHFIFGCFI